MICPEEIGELSQSSQSNVEWKILNFFPRDEKKSVYISPSFYAFDVKWLLELKPKKYLAKYSDWVSLFLWADCCANKTVHVEFGIKTVDNTVKNIKKTRYNFVGITDGWGFPQFIEMAKLKQRKSDLVPLDTLTITCSLTVEENLPSTSKRLDQLSANLKEMFISKKNWDVTVNVKEKTFFVHKSILAARSPVFGSMFEHEMSEKITNVINIIDCEPVTFNDFLLYLYCGQVDNLEKCNIIHLYTIADKYEVPELKLLCVNYLMKNLSIENMFETFVFAHRFNEDALQEKVQSFFSEHFHEIVFADLWEKFLEENSNLANQLLKAMAPNFKLKN